MKADNINIYSTAFKSGLTSAMKKEILLCEPKKISAMLAKDNVQTDFKNNKVIAWCVLRCVELLKTLNKTYDFNFSLPQRVYVENFVKLNVENTDAIGITNFAPTRLIKSKNIITPEKTIFFNEMPEWNYRDGNAFWDGIDSVADQAYDKGMATTSFFLEPIIHEFMHVLHAQKLLENFDGEIFIKKIQSMLYIQNKQFLEYKDTIKKTICSYAASNCMETVACDLSKRFINAIDKNNLVVSKSDFIQGTPYQNISWISKLFAFITDNKMDKFLRKCWEGNV